MSRSRSSCARASSPCSSAALAEATARLRDLEPAGVLVALGGQVVDAPARALLGPPGAAVGAADAGLEPVAQRGLVAGQVAQLVMADGRRAAEERLGRDAGQLGQDLVGQGRVGDGLAVVLEVDRRPSRRRTSWPACRSTRRPSSSSCSNSMATQGRASGAGVPRPQRLEVGRAARDAPGEGQLDGALDGRLAGLVGAAHDGHAGREVDVELADSGGGRGPGGGGSSQGDLVAGEQEPPEPQRVAQLGGLGGGGTRSRSIRPVGRGGRLELGDAPLEVADERPGDGVRRWQRALGQGRGARRRGRGP